MVGKDPIPGILQCLKLNSDINNLVSGRVYGEELPRSYAEGGGIDSIPKSIVVSSSTGGYGLGQRSTVRVLPFRVDLRCYGETPYDCRQVHYAVT